MEEIMGLFPKKYLLNAYSNIGEERKRKHIPSVPTPCQILLKSHFIESSHISRRHVFLSLFYRLRL